MPYGVSFAVYLRIVFLFLCLSKPVDPSVTFNILWLLWSMEQRCFANFRSGGDDLENQMGVVTRLGVASCIVIVNMYIRNSLIFEVDLVQHVPKKHLVCTW